jgi:hypothetical protein
MRDPVRYLIVVSIGKNLTKGNLWDIALFLKEGR